ncbi:MAG: hypothetical protein OQK45_08655 [Sulfurovum sp.]|nr:hypothetical protein [Sulfurovum sp.]
MKKILLGTMLSALTVNGLYANVSMKSPEIQEHPIIKHHMDQERPLKSRPIVRPTLLYGKHYHTYVTTTECNYDKYIKILKEKDKKIEALLKENERLKAESQRHIQKRLKEEYDKEMQKFEDRKK